MPVSLAAKTALNPSPSPYETATATKGLGGVFGPADVNLRMARVGKLVTITLLNNNASLAPLNQSSNVTFTLDAPYRPSVLALFPIHLQGATSAFIGTISFNPNGSVTITPGISTFSWGSATPTDCGWENDLHFTYTQA